MALHADELVPYFHGRVDEKRKELDTFYRFFHHEEKELRDAWIHPLAGLILEDLPELRKKPGLQDQLMWVLSNADEDMRDAFFFACLVIYPQMSERLLTDPAIMSADDEALTVFLRYPAHLPKMVTDFLHVEPHLTDYSSFAFLVRAEYLATVGVACEPYIPQPRQQRQAYYHLTNVPHGTHT